MKRGVLVVVKTKAGKVVAHITIWPTAKAELQARGIPIGAAAELWLKHMDNAKEENPKIKLMEENIAGLNRVIQGQAARIAELEAQAKEPHEGSE